MAAAKTGGTIRSILDRRKSFAGKQNTSEGTSKGTLTKPSELQEPENEDDGDIANTNATSEEKEATATAIVRIPVQIPAYRRSGRRWRMELKREKGIYSNFLRDCLVVWNFGG
ncbi:hypothetical protein Ancab_010547 [Ancistrocladus abbreviatus]